MRKGWKSESISYYGGYNGNYKIYEVTSPSGNVYKLHNHSNQCPTFYMETNNPGYYDKYLGKSFNEAVQELYKLEEERAFHSIKEDYKNQIYQHSYSLKDGYSVKKLDMDTVFFEQIDLLKLYKKDIREYCVYTNDKESEFQQAKEILKNIFEQEYKSVFKRQLQQAQESFDKFESMINEMMSRDNSLIEKEELEDDEYDR